MQPSDNLGSIDHQGIRFSCFIMSFIKTATIICAALLLVAVMFPTIDAAPGGHFLQFGFGPLPDIYYDYGDDDDPVPHDTYTEDDPPLDNGYLGADCLTVACLLGCKLAISSANFLVRMKNYLTRLRNTY